MGIYRYRPSVDRLRHLAKPLYVATLHSQGREEGVIELELSEKSSMHSNPCYTLGMKRDHIERFHKMPAEIAAML